MLRGLGHNLSHASSRRASVLLLVLAVVWCLVLLLHPLLHTGLTGHAGDTDCALCAVLQGLQMPLAAAILAVGLGVLGWLITPPARRAEVVSLAGLSSRAPPSR